MAYGWQNSCQLRSCNYLQNVGATTYKKFLQFYAKKACKKQSRPVNESKVLTTSQALNLLKQRGYIIKDDLTPAMN